MIARQTRHRLTQRAHIELTAEAIAGGRRAIQVAPRHVELGIFCRAVRHIAALEFQGHALGQEVFYRELIQLLAAIAEVEQQLPAPGRRFIGQLQLVLIEAGIISLPDEFAADLLIRPAYFDIYRLGFYRAAIGIAQQAV